MALTKQCIARDFGTWTWSAKLSIFRVPATTNSQWLAVHWSVIVLAEGNDIAVLATAGLFSAVSVAEPTTVQATATSSLTVPAHNGSLHPQPNSLLSDFRPTLSDSLVNAGFSFSLTMALFAVLTKQ
ncbi:hypothetical protein ARMSODRAFT_1018885 [Armillaria solidipes]|uniref:Uncharacterized protein n=1 Tax=Armillaria solidipes TaxID=1076256 RepID=A0A2H3BTX9_9AGAR|nr:hypothetical protein ARMSODRAFT_1018885 [Armillaria solidipes]